MAALRLSVAVASVLLLLPAISVCQNPIERAKQRGEKIPDIQIMGVQFIDASGADPAGDISPSTVRVQVRNNTEKTVRGILWEIDVFPVSSRTKAEAIKAYTAQDQFDSNRRLMIIPHQTVDISFYVVRKVHLKTDRIGSIQVLNYAYSAYNPAEKADLTFGGPPHFYQVEAWPFKPTAGPVSLDNK